MSMTDTELQAYFQRGGILAYPTEGVFGLGCDPEIEASVLAICALKKRPVEKGLILIADEFERVRKYVDLDLVPETMRRKIFASWPGPVTWLLPKTASAPKSVTGEHPLIAVRVSANKTVGRLCRLFDSAMVSTSANLAGQPSALTSQECSDVFGDDVFVVEGTTDGRTQPSDIYNGLTGELLRG